MLNVPFFISEFHVQVSLGLRMSVLLQSVWKCFLHLRVTRRGDPRCPVVSFYLSEVRVYQLLAPLFWGLSSQSSCSFKQLLPVGFFLSAFLLLFSSWSLADSRWKLLACPVVCRPSGVSGLLVSHCSGLLPSWVSCDGAQRQGSRCSRTHILEPSGFSFP